jgi:hypothetical protein
VAEYSFTGIATNPKETVSDAIDLAAMKLPPDRHSKLRAREGTPPAWCKLVENPQPGHYKHMIALYFEAR